MRILLGVQGTGNGHISRAREIIPFLERYGTVDIAVSGTQADVALTQKVKYKLHGFSFIFGTKGGIDIPQTLREMDLRRLLSDIKSFPLSQYDLVINDFEPVTAWACHRQKKQCIALGHQAAFLSPLTPRPKNRTNWAEFVLEHYAPTTAAVGFHFERYDSFIHTPVIRSEIRQLEPSRKGHYTVYLPAYSDETLITYLSRVNDVQWQVFSKHTKTSYTVKNIAVTPVQNEGFNLSLASSEGLLTGGGFEGPAEAMFLGKKVLTVPMTGQWEQSCNAEAMRRLGVSVVPQIREGFEKSLQAWVETATPIEIDFPDETGVIIAALMAKYAKNG